MLSQQAVFEFQQIYKKNFGLEISFDEANEKARKFLELFKIVFKPLSIPEKNYEKNRAKKTNSLFKRTY